MFAREAGKTRPLKEGGVTPTEGQTIWNGKGVTWPTVGSEGKHRKPDGP